MNARPQYRGNSQPSPRIRSLFVIPVLLLALASAVQASDPTLYAVDLSDNVLLTVDPLDASTVEIGPLGVNDQMVNIAYIDGRLLGMERSDGLFEIDPLTGAASQIAPLPDGYVKGTALAYDPTTDSLYATFGVTSGSIQDQLAKIDPDTGVLIELIGTLPFDGDGMSIDPITGQMYLLAIETATETNLWQVEKTDATAINLGNIGLQPCSGMAFHPGTNDLYVADVQGALAPGLHILNPSDLSSTLVGNLDYPGVSGLAFVPEPSTALLLVAVGATTLRRRSLLSHN